MEEEKWIEFVGTLRNLGNKGKSRGINVSMITNINDIGRHVVGRFRFTDQEPDTKEIDKARKEYIVDKRSDKILDIKTNCFNNQMMHFAKNTGMRVETLLTSQNLEIYLELWAQFTTIDTIIKNMQQQGKEQKDIKEQEKQLKEQIVSKLKATYGQIPQIIITAVEDDVLMGYTQEYIDKLIEFSENIMTDRTLLWKRKKKQKK